LAAIGLEYRLEFRQVDADNHRPLPHELLRQDVRAAVPAFIAGQEQHKTGRFAGGRIDREIVESAVAQHRRRGPDGSAQEHQRGEGQADTEEADIQKRANIHRMVTLETQNVHE